MYGRQEGGGARGSHAFLVGQGRPKIVCFLTFLRKFLCFLDKKYVLAPLEKSLRTPMGRCVPVMWGIRVWASKTKGKCKFFRWKCWEEEYRGRRASRSRRTSRTCGRCTSSCAGRRRPWGRSDPPAIFQNPIVKTAEPYKLDSFTYLFGIRNGLAFLLPCLKWVVGAGTWSRSAKLITSMPKVRKVPSKNRSKRNIWPEKKRWKF